MINESNKNGSRGEGIAAGFLTKKQYNIICKNYTCKGGEIDIIAKNGEYYVFVEVKSRKNLQFSAPANYVTETKQKRIIYTAKHFMYKSELDIYSTAMRFDVVEVVGDDNVGYKLRHIENAFTD